MRCRADASPSWTVHHDRSRLSMVSQLVSMVRSPALSQFGVSSCISRPSRIRTHATNPTTNQLKVPASSSVPVWLSCPLSVPFPLPRDPMRSQATGSPSASKSFRSTCRCRVTAMVESAAKHREMDAMHQVRTSVLFFGLWFVVVCEYGGAMVVFTTGEFFHEDASGVLLSRLYEVSNLGRSCSSTCVPSSLGTAARVWLAWTSPFGTSNSSRTWSVWSLSILLTFRVDLLGLSCLVSSRSTYRFASCFVGWFRVRHVTVSQPHRTAFHHVLTTAAASVQGKQITTTTEERRNVNGRTRLRVAMVESRLRRTRWRTVSRRGVVDGSISPFDWVQWVEPSLSRSIRTHDLNRERVDPSIHPAKPRVRVKGSHKDRMDGASMTVHGVDPGSSDGREPTPADTQIPNRRGEENRGNKRVERVDQTTRVCCCAWRACAL